MENKPDDMKDLSTTYLGLNLKNPLIVGSCGFTNSVDKIAELARNGAGAVVLKSLFEEQILADLSANLESYTTDYPGATDYVREYTRGNEVEAYLGLIAGAKKKVDIPVIASINCVSDKEWTSFAKSVENEGADALELNVSLLPSNPRMTSEQNERMYLDVVGSISEKVSIPVVLKMSHYSASLANLIQKLSWTDKIAGFVLFNRYYSPDIDVEKMVVKSSELLSNPAEGTLPLRWIALLSGIVEKDLVASTGVHDSDGMIKQLLAGATAVQIVSTIYKNGMGQIGTILQGLESWMEQKSFAKIDDFRGSLAYDKVADPAVFERTQFMKYYGGLS
ncbi:dihydroorotate dehydrogenase-like protein [Desulforhopalus sp. IMCC35007]|uniref:dihydroorotate dehydrogenase-like protein n=1 Tax=Desulforhopalus sp. IMCC35007 TaxID=2569543 RepID=UPI001F0E1024|nr:dihydroorotate dehydrogenase-like protein [Desulforhopalus sp. IMCC35007]